MKSVEETKKEVIEWLMHPHELGKKPHAVEYVKTYTREDGLDCMIFKYKKGLLSPWLLTIACEAGIFSHMEKYDPVTEDKDASDLMDALIKFWKNKAAEEEERKERAKKAGKFVAFVLLKEESWDHEKFEKDFADEWGAKLSDPRRPHIPAALHFWFLPLPD